MTMTMTMTMTMMMMMIYVVHRVDLMVTYWYLENCECPVVFHRKLGLLCAGFFWSPGSGTRISPTSTLATSLEHCRATSVLTHPCYVLDSLEPIWSHNAITIYDFLNLFLQPSGIWSIPLHPHFLSNEWLKFWNFQSQHMLFHVDYPLMMKDLHVQCTKLTTTALKRSNFARCFCHRFIDEQHVWVTQGLNPWVVQGGWTPLSKQVFLDGKRWYSEEKRSMCLGLGDDVPFPRVRWMMKSRSRGRMSNKQRTLSKWSIKPG